MPMLSDASAGLALMQALLLNAAYGILQLWSEIRHDDAPNRNQNQRSWLNTLGAMWAWLFLLALVLFFSLAKSGISDTL